jgi:hypothetical protein
MRQSETELWRVEDAAKHLGYDKQAGRKAIERVCSQYGPIIGAYRPLGTHWCIPLWGVNLIPLLRKAKGQAIICSFSLDCFGETITKISALHFKQVRMKYGKPESLIQSLTLDQVKQLYSEGKLPLLKEDPDGEYQKVELPDILGPELEPCQ